MIPTIFHIAKGKEGNEREEEKKKKNEIHEPAWMEIRRKYERRWNFEKGDRDDRRGDDAVPVHVLVARTYEGGSLGGTFDRKDDDLRLQLNKPTTK